MSELNRRTFVSALIALPAGAVAVGDLFIQTDDRTLLLALSEVVLPTELGEAQRVGLTERFERWISSYRPGAEVNHGYGTGRLEYLPADPWPRWREQLRALDARALTQLNAGFNAATRDQRFALVTADLDALKAERIPNPLTAPHIALALLGWFVATPEATDLCYHANIGKETCRALAATRQNPARQP
jgi:hypothetical protein